MGRFKVLLFLCALACLMTGCSSAGSEAVPANFKPISALEETGPEDTPEEPAPPAKEDVLAAREEALEGMPPEQIDRLTAAVTAANLWLEQEYLYDGLFGRLEDPDSLYWNYFDQTGEVQIAWAYDGSLDMEAVCAEEGLTEAEFYSRYGARVLDTNRHTADDFIVLMEELEAAARNEGLKAELRDLAAEMELAKGHVMEHLNNVYKKLHDLDYFLLRYGPEVFEGYASSYDKSTVSKYYGTLSFYA